MKIEQVPGKPLRSPPMMLPCCQQRPQRAAGATVRPCGRARAGATNKMQLAKHPSDAPSCEQFYDLLRSCGPAEAGPKWCPGGKRIPARSWVPSGPQPYTAAAKSDACK